MRLLFVINTGLVGGLQQHVLTLMRALAGVAETAVVLNTIIDERVVALYENAGMKVYRLDGTSGHDRRVVGRFRKVLADFSPDVIHAHGLPLFVAVDLLLRRNFCRTSTSRVPIVHSLHTPTTRPTLKKRLENFVHDRLVDYWLPVSGPTWETFRAWHPHARGEVFFNPLCLADFVRREHVDHDDFIVGMVGRNAAVKDWPSFHEVERIVKVNAPKPPLFLNAGEKEVCDGRAAIRSMDLFMLTSISEEMPTVLLECFALGTPVCGFLPRGGTSDILQFSTGPVRDAFIKERSCEKLADLVLDLLKSPEKRAALVEDGRQILEGHFDAVKNCRGQLMEVYGRMVGRKEQRI